MKRVELPNLNRHSKRLGTGNLIQAPSQRSDKNGDFTDGFADVSAQTEQMPISRLSSLPAWLLGERLLNHGVTDGQLAGQFLRESVALSQVVRTGRTHPDLLFISSLPDKDFERQIKREKRGRNHEWSAPLRIAKDQDMGLLHREANPLRFSTVVNLGKDGQIPLTHRFLKAFQGLLDRKRTGSGHNTLDRGRRSWLS